MTLDEACGIYQCNIDKATDRELNHHERYGRYIEYLGGLDAVKLYIPFELGYLIPKYTADEHMNNTPIKEWDYAAGFRCVGPDAFPTYQGLWNLYRQHGITQASCATGVCILKEAARMLIEAQLTAPQGGAKNVRFSRDYS